MRDAVVDLFIAFGIACILETVRIAFVYFIYHLVQMLNNVIKLDTEVFGKSGGTAEVDGFENRLDGSGGNIVTACDFCEGDRL